MMSFRSILYLFLLAGGTQTRFGEATHPNQDRGSSSPEHDNQNAAKPPSQGDAVGHSDMVAQTWWSGNDKDFSLDLVQLDEPGTQDEVDVELLPGHDVKENEGGHMDNPITTGDGDGDVTALTGKNLRDAGRKFKVVVNKPTMEHRPLAAELLPTLKTASLETSQNKHRSLRVSTQRHDVFDWLHQASLTKVPKNVSCASKNSQSVYVCHYDEQRDMYMTLCIRISDLQQHMTTNVKDRRGRCSDVNSGQLTDSTPLEACPSAARPTCDDRNPCTNDSTFCRASISAWKCIHTPKFCRSGTRCDSTDGQCKSPDEFNAQRGCPSPTPSCDDSNFCTDDSAFCQESVPAWGCTNSPRVCNSPGTSCDLVDGQCKADDDLVPCVAVIDEDSNFDETAKWQQWEEFRAQYPRRPFCLLVPAPIPYLSHQNVSLPDSFISDGLTTFVFGISRDHGVSSKADDWVERCRLDGYNSANVGSVGLFIDVSGSMSESDVVASRDMFITRLNDMGIEVKKVVNREENWILPFMTNLAS